jgi:hypothetical protein
MTMILRIALLLAASAAAIAADPVPGAADKAPAAKASAPKGGAAKSAEGILAIGRFVLVARPAKAFGDVEARKDTVFHLGETMNFYGEPKNLAYPRNAGGAYEPAFEVDVEIRQPDGKTIKQDKFATIRLPAKQRTQDAYVNLSLALNQVPPGTYSVKFVFRDLNSKRVGAAVQDVTIK